MNCAEAERLIGPWVDDELDLRATVEMENHVARCPECARERDELLALRDTARERLPRYDLPPQLEQRLWSKVREAAASEEKAKRPRPRRWVREASMMAAAACLAVVVTVAVQRGGVGDEVIDAHLRSLQAQHLTDVVSSDQHTVKPWFQGKVDFSVPARDFSEQGFVLAGGRLDVLDGRPVAAIVYRRRQHVLNLFVWPDGRTDRAPRSFTERGYRVTGWAQGGLEYRLVSDVPANEVDELVSLLRSS
ncbi:MAG TPA: zf-HC2 domain-containing protein [Myxococcales bacterium]|nr:zf-HC2 domain-containing protein [Myxococcales bacterium]